MAISVIRYGTIRTTLPKAKELRSFLEPLITLSKVDNLAKRRRAFSLLGNKEAVGKLFSTTSQVCMDRPGGYLSILKAGIRAGDDATLALVRLVGAPEDYAEQGNRPVKEKSSRKETNKEAKKEAEKKSESKSKSSKKKEAKSAAPEAKEDSAKATDVADGQEEQTTEDAKS